MSTKTLPPRDHARIALHNYREKKTYGSLNSPGALPKTIIDCVQCGVHPAVTGERNNRCWGCDELNRCIPTAASGDWRRATGNQQIAARREAESSRAARRIQLTGRILLFGTILVLILIVYFSGISNANAIKRDRYSSRGDEAR